MDLLHIDSYIICIYRLYILYTNLRNCMDNCFCLLWVNPVMSKNNDHIWGSYLMRVEALTRHKTVFFNMLLIKKRGYVCWKNAQQMAKKSRNRQNNYKHAWIEPKKKYNMGVSKNGGTPKWMVKIMENPIKMDDLGGKPTIFGNLHMLLQEVAFVSWTLWLSPTLRPPPEFQPVRVLVGSPKRDILEAWFPGKSCAKLTHQQTTTITPKMMFG